MPDIACVVPVVPKNVLRVCSMGHGSPTRTESRLRKYRISVKYLDLMKLSKVCATNPTIPMLLLISDTGVSAIIHTAAPVIGPSITHASQLIKPTVKGTENLLNSALAYAGSQLESFVFTSSAAAVITPGAQPPHTYDDNSWNKIHPLLLKDGVEYISVYEAYPCAKIAAEKLVWAFRDTKKV